MYKNVLFSAKLDHEIIEKVVQKLKQYKNINLSLHDPTKEFFNLSRIPKKIKEADIIIAKIRNDCSLDLLHYAKLNNIPTLHDIDTVLMCKNKIALDFALRKILSEHGVISRKFGIPSAWNQNALNINKFKKWAESKLPIVIKSHYQHDKYNRFNFLARKIEEIDLFHEKYKNFIYYDVYIQKFIECDGIDRKVYVIGDKVYGVTRENPIYIFLREKPDNIDVDEIKRKTFDVSEDIKKLAKVLSKGLNLKIFGFDLIKPITKKKLYLIDLNDFPGFRGIKGIENVLAQFLMEFIENVQNN